jgi:hypothetical protein
MENLKKLYERIDLAGRGICPHPMLKEIDHQEDVHWSQGFKIPDTNFPGISYRPYVSDTYSITLYEKEGKYFLLKTKYFNFENGRGNKNIEYETLDEVINI